MIMEGWTNKLALRTDGLTSMVSVWVGAAEGRWRPPGFEMHWLGLTCIV